MSVTSVLTTLHDCTAHKMVSNGRGEEELKVVQRMIDPTLPVFSDTERDI